MSRNQRKGLEILDARDMALIILIKMGTYQVAVETLRSSDQVFDRFTCLITRDLYFASSIVIILISEMCG